MKHDLVNIITNRIHFVYRGNRNAGIVAQEHIKAPYIVDETGVKHDFEKSVIYLKKVLDKREHLWYSVQARSREATKEQNG